MRHFRGGRWSDTFAAPQKNLEPEPVLVGPPPDVSKAEQPKNIDPDGAIEGGKNSPQRKDPVIPTTHESDKEYLTFHATTQQFSGLPGDALQEDSTDLLHPTGEIDLGELVTKKSTTNHGLPTDVAASTAEEEGQYIVFVKGMAWLLYSATE